MINLLSTDRTLVSFAKKKYKNSGGRIREFDPLAYESVNKTSTHDQFNCPFCIDRRGKVDTDGKFYWHREKMIGWCFKCESIGVLESDMSKSELELSIMINGLKSGLEKHSNTKPDFTLSSINFDSMFDKLSDEGREYLIGRCPLYADILDDLNIRSFGKRGVVIPVYIGKDIVSYQIRYFEHCVEGGRKYYIPKTSEKVLYSPTRAVGNTKFCKVTLVEGAFDAISALLMGYPNPIATYGKTLTEVQLYLLRSMSPTEVNIMMDENSISWEVYHKIKRQFPTAGRPKVIYTWGEDAEEILNKRISKLSEGTMESFLNIYNSAVESIRKSCN